MVTPRFELLTRSLASATETHRRTILHGAAWLAAGLSGAALLTDVGEAKRKPKKRKTKPLCEANGSRCQKKGSACRTGNCLKSSFSVEAAWQGANTLYDTYLFVPKNGNNQAPGPFISSVNNKQCTAAASDCENNVYPFACISQDASGPGPEVLTVRKLLKGKYEYWFYVINNSAAGAVTITLRNANAQIVRSWSSPANNTAGFRGWHVFDLDGATGSVKSINDLSINGMPFAARNPSTNVCPGIPA